MFKKYKNKHKRHGFSLVELIVVIGIMAILVAVLAPSLLQYTEKSRAKRDEAAMSEVANAVKLAMADEKCYDEMLRYSCANNYVTYTDSSGKYGQTIADAEFWAPDGLGKATTITFNPIKGGSGKMHYSLEYALVNDMTYANGSSGSGDQRVMEGSAIDNNQCYLKNTSLSDDGSPTGYLYHKIRQVIGNDIVLTSATYKNSSYTIFIKFNQIEDIIVAEVDGSFNGTNLYAGAQASVGSGTSEYDEVTKDPIVTKPNGGTHSKPTFNQSDLIGGGSGSVVDPDYKVDNKFDIPTDNVSPDECSHASVRLQGKVNATCTNDGYSGDRVCSSCGTTIETGSVIKSNGHEAKLVGVIEATCTSKGYTGDKVCKYCGIHMEDGHETNALGHKDNNGDGECDVCHTVPSGTLDKEALGNVVKNSEATITEIVFVNSGVTGGNAQDVSEEKNGSISAWIEGSKCYVSAVGVGRKIAMPIDSKSFFDATKEYGTGYAAVQKISGCSNLDFSKVEMTNDMFAGCANLETIEGINEWNTGNVYIADGMFYGCASLESLDLSDWDVSDIASVVRMFGDCTSLETLNMSGWKLESARLATSMFSGCSNLTTIYVSSAWSTPNLESHENMFYGCTGLKGGADTTYDANHVNAEYARIDKGETAPGYFTDVNHTAHSYRDGGSKDATCTEDGFKKFVCDCGATFTEVIPATKHVEVAIPAIVPTCQADGWTAGVKCEVCKEVLTAPEKIVSDGTNHSFGEIEYVWNGLDDGNDDWDFNHVTYEASRECSICHTNENESAKMGFKDLQEATCENDGSVVITATFENPVFVDAEKAVTLESKGHQYGEFVYTWTGISEEGSAVANDDNVVCHATKTCSVCGDEATTNSSSVSSEITKAPTCIEPGIRTYTAIFNHVSYGNPTATEVIPAVGAHADGDDADYNCDVCSKALTGTLSKEALDSVVGAETTTILLFNGTEIPSDAEIADVSIEENGSVVAWREETTVYVSALDESKQILMPESCSYFFAGKGNPSQITGYANIQSMNLAMLDTSKVKSMQNMFNCCDDLTSLVLSGWDTSKVTGMSYMFRNCTSLTYLDLSGFDTSGALYMSNMFYGCSSLTTLDLSDFDTSSVTRMDSMFRNCSSLTTIYVSDSWSTKAITILDYSNSMFEGCESIAGGNGTGLNSSYLDKLYARIDKNGEPGYLTDISQKESNNNTLSPGKTWYKSSQAKSTIKVIEFANNYVPGNSDEYIEVWNADVNNFGGIKAYIMNDGTTLRITNNGNNSIYAHPYAVSLFYNFSQLSEIQYLNLLNTSNVKNMSSVFNGCSSLTTLDLSGWDTDNAKTLYLMFYNCSNLTTLDLSGWETDNVTSMYGMFLNCSSLTTIYVSDSWSTTAVADSTSMFKSCTKLTGGNGTKYSSSYTNKTYARIDGGPDSKTPGYFTLAGHTEHTYFEEVTTEATCAENGVKTFTCNDCGAVKIEVIPATGIHTEEELKAKDPTCTATGLTAGVKCSVCGEILVAQEELPMLAHVYTSYDPATKAPEWDWAKDRTPAIATFKCDNCGGNPIEITDDEITVTTVNPSCLVNGAEEYEASVEFMDKTYKITETKILDAPGHVYTKTVVDPTCEEGGYTINTCSCGDRVISDNTAAIGHSFNDDDWYETKPASCTEKGEKERECARENCYEIETGEIPKLDHTKGEVKVENEVEATCTIDGSCDNVVYCIVCNAELSRETIVTSHALKHTDADGDTVCDRCTQDSIIPNGAIYTVSNGTVLNGGDEFPSTVKQCDTYTYGDYEYCYGYCYCDCEDGVWSNECGCEDETNGWAVHYIGDDDVPDPMLGIINGQPITSLTLTFHDNADIKDARNIDIPNTVIDLCATFSRCENLIYAPVIPNGVKSISATFDECVNLTTVPNIPDSVTIMSYAFYNCKKLTNVPATPSGVEDMSGAFEFCTSLSGNIEINANPSEYDDCFYNVNFESQGITLIGSSEMLDDLGRTGINYCDVCNGKCSCPRIPTGGKYTKSDGTVLTDGKKFPIVSVGDVYTYGDYEYCYGYRYCDCEDGVWSNECGCEYETNGWAVHYIGDDDVPGPMLSIINGQPITSLTFTFYDNVDIKDARNIDIPNTVVDLYSTFSGCTNLIYAPVIPNGVTSMGATFYGCERLTSVPNIPDSVTIMSHTFFSCEKLTSVPATPSGVEDMCGAFDLCTSLYGNIEINANPSEYDDCFHNVNFESQNITLAGSASDETLDALGATGNNYCDTCNGKCYETITFSVSGKEYQAEKGMKWNEWINSEYAPDMFSAKDGGMYFRVVDNEVRGYDIDYVYHIVYGDSERVHYSDNIRNGSYYEAHGYEQIARTLNKEALDTVVVNGVESIMFNGTEIPDDATLTDVSEGAVGSIFAWIEGTTVYVSALDETKEIYMPERSSYFFAGYDLDLDEYTDYATVEQIDFLMLNTSNVTSMYGMFWDCSSLIGLNLSGWNTGNVTDMSYMFVNCSSLTTLDVSGWNTSNVTNIEGMFCACTSLTALDLSGWDTNNVTNMYYMFPYCMSLTTLDLSGWNTSKVTDMTRMFEDCSSLITIYASTDWNTSKVTSSADMFYGCESLVGGKGTPYNASKTDATMARIDGGLGSQTEGYFTDKLDATLSKEKLSEFVNILYYQEGCAINAIITTDTSAPEGISTQDMSMGDNGGVVAWYNETEETVYISVKSPNRKIFMPEDSSSFFAGYEYVQSMNLSKLDTSNVTDMYYMFSDCYDLTTLDLSDWNTSNVGDMGGMFYNCSSITTLDVSGFDTSNVITMEYMFAYCYSLTTLDVSGFDTSNVTNMSAMFQNCKALTTLDLSGWDTNNVTNMSGMFSSCYSLTSLDLSSFDTSNVTDMDYMFAGCVIKEIILGNNFVITNPEYIYLNQGVWIKQKNTDGTYTNDTTKFSTVDILSLGSNTTPTIGGTWILKYIGEGTIGDCSWEIDDNCVLRIYPTNGISGTLPSNDTYYYDFWPWYNYTYAKSVVIDSGVVASSSVCGMFESLNRCTTMDLSGLDTSNVTDMSRMFNGCSSLTSLDVSGFDTSNVTNMSYMFSGCYSLTSLDLSGFDTSKVTDMSRMFSNCSSLTSLDVSGFDTSNVTDMDSMFSSCSSLTSLDLSGWDTSKVTNMSLMFWYCSALTSLDLSGWNTSNVTVMNDTAGAYPGMFAGCRSLVSLDLSNFDTSKITNMNDMFARCSSLTTLDLSGFDTSNVTDMDSMFSDCTSLTSLDLSGFDTSKVTDMSLMFWYCSALTSLDLSGWNAGNVTNMSEMFRSCSSLTSLDLSGWNAGKLTDTGAMFQNCKALTTLDLSGWNAGNVTTMGAMFRDCSSLTSLDLSGWNAGKLTSMSYMFEGCSSLTTLDLSGLNAGELTTMSFMFSGCSSLTSLDLSGWNTENVTNMYGMFSNCSSLTSLDLSGWNAGNVTSMSYMFEGCSSLTTLDLSGLNAGKLIDMSYMFYSCSSLTSLDLSGWNTGNVKYMSEMFDCCYELTKIYVSDSWSTAAVTSSSSMFSGCNKLVGGNGTVFDSSKKDATMACIDKPGQPGYFTCKHADCDNESYSWSGYTSCVAEATCLTCSVTLSESGTITNAVTTAAGCTTTGVKTYTATFSNTAFTEQTKTETISALGHDDERTGSGLSTDGYYFINYTCRRCGYWHREWL